MYGENQTRQNQMNNKKSMLFSSDTEVENQTEEFSTPEEFFRTTASIGQ